MNPETGPREDCIKTALSKARQWCASEERCTGDIELKLRKLGYSQFDIDNIIKQVSREGFINEQRYASAYASGKFRISKWGKIKIAAGLRLKKIPEGFISNALNEIDQDEYLGCLSLLLKKKQKELKNFSKEDIKHKMARFALQRGFESEIVFALLKTREQ